MSLSWRITTVFNDRSQRTLPSVASGSGATVVSGSRSIEEPVLFAKGETRRMLDLLGAPTRNDQGLLEAIEFNKSYPLYVVSPALRKKFNYISFISSKGYIVPVANEDYLTSLSVDKAGVYNCGRDFDESKECVVPTDILGGVASIKLYADDSTEPLEVTINESTITGAGEDADVAGTVAEGEGIYTLTLSNTGTHKGVISARYSRSMSPDTYLILAQRGCGNFLKGNIVKEILKKGAREEDNTYFLSLNYQVLNNYGDYQTDSRSPIKFTLEKGAQDGFQNSLNAEVRFATNDFFKAIYNPRMEGSTKQFQYSLDEEGSPSEDVLVWAFDLNAVTRNVEDDDWNSDTDFAGGYAFFHKTNSYQPDLFFDATGKSEVLSLLQEIRANYHPYSRVLVPLYTEDPESIEQALEGISSIPADRGFSAYWGEFEIENPYSLEHPVLQGIPMGMIAKRHSDSIVLSYGGRAVAWIDENGVGGQLTGSRLIRGLADPSEADLETLDNNRINPVIYTDVYGPMILSRRTTYTDYSDYSFNDYSGIIDYCVKNIVKNALPYQIVKLNDAIHRSIVRNRINSILNPLTVAPNNVIADYAIKCDSENNNEEAKDKEEFVVEVAIQVTSKSRTIKLIFTNAGQTTSVEEVLAS